MARDRGVDDLGGKITHGEFTSNRGFLCNVLPLECYAEKPFSGAGRADRTDRSSTNAEVSYVICGVA
jgi:hypothetical protein